MYKTDESTKQIYREQYLTKAIRQIIERIPRKIRKLRPLRTWYKQKHKKTCFADYKTNEKKNQYKIRNLTDKYQPIADFRSSFQLV